MGRADQHGMKGTWVDGILYLLCDLELWLCPWILKVKYSKSSIIWISGCIHIKRCESIRCWTQVVTLNFYLTHDLDLGFSRWIFNGHILGMGRSIDMGWKRCELDTMLDAQLTSSWPTVHGKQISFQSVGPWMSYSFTDLGAEGCCRSLNALLYILLSKAFTLPVLNVIFKRCYRWVPVMELYKCTSNCLENVNHLLCCVMLDWIRTNKTKSGNIFFGVVLLSLRTGTTCFIDSLTKPTLTKPLPNPVWASAGRIIIKTPSYHYRGSQY